MSNLKKFVPLALSISGAILGYVLTNSVKFGFCTPDAYSCRDLLNKIGDPLLYGTGALVVVFVLLLLVPKAWSAWKKFAIWFVPIAALLFILYKGPGSGDLFSPDPEFVFKWVSILYVVINVGIIALVALKGKK
jgi:hypothetical protein